MVRMCPYSFSLTWLVIAASVVDLPEPVGPVHKIKPRGLLVISAKIFGVASSSSESTFEGIVRNATAAPRSWLYALTRNRARLVSRVRPDRTQRFIRSVKPGETPRALSLRFAPYNL